MAGGLRLQDSQTLVGRKVPAAQQSYEAIREDIIAFRVGDIDRPATAAATAATARTMAYHKERFAKSMRRYFGVRVDLLSDTNFLASAHIAENVALIRTIPERHLAALLDDLTKLASDQPFNQQKVMSVLRNRYKSSGYNVRRLTRDQTSKLIGQLNRHRQTELGIAQYVWQTAGDERVRPSHRDNDGQTFSWANGSPIGHPGEEIQCRCTPLAVIPSQRSVAAPPSQREALGVAPPMRPGSPGWSGLSSASGGPFSGIGRRLTPVEFDAEINRIQASNPFTRGRRVTFHSADDHRLHQMSDEARAEVAAAWDWLARRYQFTAGQMDEFRTIKRNPRGYIAATGSNWRIKSFGDDAVEEARNAGRDRIGGARDWTKRPEQTVFPNQANLNFNPEFYGHVPGRIGDGGGDWVAGARLRRYGRNWGPETHEQKRVRTVIHEFGHQVGYNAFTRWWADDFLAYRRRLDDWYQKEAAYLRGDLARLPAMPRAPSEGSRKVGQRAGPAMKRFRAMLERHSKELGTPRNGLPVPRGTYRNGLTRYDPEDWMREVSEYATDNLHEFTAEAFTAVTMYGDDAPLVARLWIREVMDAVEAMELETRTALGL